jgi:hypothetical protein
MYGWDAPEEMCFFRDSGTKLSIVWQWAVYYSWEIICILYCTATLISVVIKLSKQSLNNVSDKTMTSQHEKNALRNKTIMSLVVKRIIWYPIVPIITQAPNFLVETDIYINQKVNYAFLIMSTFFASQGFLNTIVFMQDIAVSRAGRLAKLSWWNNYVNKYEELYPHLSRNKASGHVDNEVKQHQESQKQPLFAEKLRYNLLTTLFNKPKEDTMLGEYDEFMTLKDDEEISTLSIKEKKDGDATIDDEDNALEQFNKEVLCKL